MTKYDTIFHSDKKCLQEATDPQEHVFASIPEWLEHLVCIGGDPNCGVILHNIAIYDEKKEDTCQE